MNGYKFGKLLLWHGCLVAVLLGACDAPKLIERMDPEHTGILFNNRIQETDSFNILDDEFMYNGGGVALADLNADGLVDIYFTGNRVANKLYLNKGDFRFEDVSEKSGTLADDIWSSGISIIDINTDGLLDLYISATHEKDPQKRKNKLLINQGNDPDGIPIFKDQAELYGLADTSHTTHSVFFDYDLDGDLDLYMLLDEMILKRSSTLERKKLDGSSLTTDKLFKNDHGKFTDVSREAGILIEGFGLGVAVLDVNQDNYPDLYISNDFVTNDVLYVNNQDGTFTNRIRAYIKHQSYSSMGNDVADINGDGKLDIMTLDMLPNTNQRVKQMMNQTRFIFYDLLLRRDYELQYVRNSLQLSNGNGYSEVSQLAGVEATDWSWSILFADYNNSGDTDIFISNGFPRDVTDLDFGHYRVGVEGKLSATHVVLAQIPEVKIRNFFYQNKGNLAFEDVSEQWGLSLPSFSNGTAYGDLDNDGDLDLVVNNINDAAFVFQNHTREQYPDRNYLQVKLEGPSENPLGLGAKIWLKRSDGKTEFREFYPFRGYISSMDPKIHFGLGSSKEVVSLRVRWHDGKETILHSVSANQTIKLSYENAQEFQEGLTKVDGPVFKNISHKLGLELNHIDPGFQDFRIQALLPHTHSNEGPGIAIGDVNGDGWEDVFIGGGRDHPGKFLIQNREGRFDTLAFEDHMRSENLGALLVDVDLDEDLDLYLANGSSEYLAYDTAFQDRLYLNDGKGNFRYDSTALPTFTISSSSVNAADVDRDGDLDLFVGGRLIPQSYPLPEKSYLLTNDGGTFTDMTTAFSPEMDKLGMVSSALWTDFNDDGWEDLVVVGEWMPITFFQNEQGSLTKIEPTIKNNSNGQLTTIKNARTSGWWNSISGADMDKDGDIDYVLGNQGLNNQYKPSEKYPLKIIAKDFDGNGSTDHMIGAYREGAYYPIHLRNDFLTQLNGMKRRFFKFADYASARFDDIFTDEELMGAYFAETYMFESIYLENKGSEGFVIHPLPIEVQFSPTYGTMIEDVNEDGNLDIMLLGNKYGTETFSGRHDASFGNVLLGNGAGDFSILPNIESGFVVPGDARALAQIFTKEGRAIFLASQNNDQLMAFVKNNPSDHKLFPLKTLETSIQIYYKDGRMERRIFPYVSGYLSLSSRIAQLDTRLIEKVIAQCYDGRERTIYPN